MFQGQGMAESYDAHACGKEDAAFGGNPHAAQRLALRALTNKGHAYLHSRS